MRINFTSTTERLLAWISHWFRIIFQLFEAWTGPHFIRILFPILWLIQSKVYVLRIEDLESGVWWSIEKRYRDFYELQQQLTTLWPSLVELPFPPKVGWIILHRTNRVLCVVTCNRGCWNRTLHQVMTLLPTPLARKAHCKDAAARHRGKDCGPRAFHTYMRICGQFCMFNQSTRQSKPTKPTKPTKYLEKSVDQTDKTDQTYQTNKTYQMFCHVNIELIIELIT